MEWAISLCLGVMVKTWGRVLSEGIVNIWPTFGLFMDFLSHGGIYPFDRNSTIILEIEFCVFYRNVKRVIL